MTPMCATDLSENVISLQERLALRGGRVAEVTDEERIHKYVERELGTTVLNTKLCQAQARAVNLFHSNMSMNESIRCAVAWARYSLDLSPPPAA